MKWLVINADDFGLDPAVNAAVRQAHTTGLLTSASLLVTGPAVAAAPWQTGETVEVVPRVVESLIPATPIRHTPRARMLVPHRTPAASAVRIVQVPMKRPQHA